MINLRAHWQALRSACKKEAMVTMHAFIVSEIKKVQGLMGSLTGVHVLGLGDARFWPGIQNSGLTQDMWLSDAPETFTTLTDKQGDSRLSACFDALPLLSDVLDVVYLAHCLEGVQNAHEILREACRVLKPSGHILISNFNPWSLWGLWRWWLRLSGPAPWRWHSMGPAQLQDWLALLGFEVLQVSYHFFRPPVHLPGCFERLQWLEKAGQFGWPTWGGGYILLARKRHCTLTPIRTLARSHPVTPVPACV